MLAKNGNLIELTNHLKKRILGGCKIWKATPGGASFQTDMIRKKQMNIDDGHLFGFINRTEGGSMAMPQESEDQTIKKFTILFGRIGQLTQNGIIEVVEACLGAEGFFKTLAPKFQARRKGTLVSIFG